MPGTSGTQWEIDAKGCPEDGTHFIVVECKRYPNRGISQAITAAPALMPGLMLGKSARFDLVIGAFEAPRRYGTPAKVPCISCRM